LRVRGVEHTFAVRRGSTARIITEKGGGQSGGEKKSRPATAPKGGEGNSIRIAKKNKGGSDWGSLFRRVNALPGKKTEPTHQLIRCKKKRVYPPSRGQEKGRGGGILRVSQDHGKGPQEKRGEGGTPIFRIVKEDRLEGFRGLLRALASRGHPLQKEREHQIRGRGQKGLAKGCPPSKRGEQ